MANGSEAKTPIKEDNADKMAMNAVEITLPKTISFFLIGVINKVAKVPLSFSPAMASVPILIPPAKMNIIINIGKSIASTDPVAFFSSYTGSLKLSMIFVFIPITCKNPSF